MQIGESPPTHHPELARGPARTPALDLRDEDVAVLLVDVRAGRPGQGGSGRFPFHPAWG